MIDRLPPVLQTVVVALAVAGAVAVVARLARALLRLGIDAAEETAASGLAEVSARRGDLTAFEEQRAAQASLRRDRRRDLLWVGLYGAWLVVPAFTPVAPFLYAAGAPLWLLPRRPVRRRRETPQG